MMYTRSGLTRHKSCQGLEKLRLGFVTMVRRARGSTTCWDSSQVSLTPPVVPCVISLSVISPKFAVSDGSLFSFLLFQHLSVLVSHIYCRDDLGGTLRLSDTRTVPSVRIQHHRPTSRVTRPCPIIAQSRGHWHNFRV